MHTLQSFIMRSHHLLPKDAPTQSVVFSYWQVFQCFGVVLIVWCVVPGPVLLISFQPCLWRQSFHGQALCATCSANMWMPSWGTQYNINKCPLSWHTLIFKAHLPLTQHSALRTVLGLPSSVHRGERNAQLLTTPRKSQLEWFHRLCSGALRQKQSWTPVLSGQLPVD